MKHLTSLFLLLNFFLNSFSQESTEFRFGGNMNDKIWSQLTNEERNLFYDCVKECGLNKDSIVWVSNKTFNLIMEDDDKLNVKVVRKYSDGIGNKVIDFKSTIGRNLDSRECMVFIDRSKLRTEIVLQVYY